MDIGYEKFLEYYKNEAASVPEEDKPFFLSHGDKTAFAFLLIHGFTATPWEMRELGKFLYNKGYNVFGLKLPGHAASPDDLLGLKWEDWYKASEDAFNIISLSGDKIIAAGLSTGSNLCLYLASKRPDLFAVISMSGALFFKDCKIALVPFAKYFIKYNIRPYDDIRKPHYYEKRPLAAIHEVYKLAKIIRRVISKVKQPLLIIQAKGDDVIKYKSSEYIYKYAGSINKMIKLLENDQHVIIIKQSGVQDMVFEIIGNWVQGIDKI